MIQESNLASPIFEDDATPKTVGEFPLRAIREVREDWTDIYIGDLEVRLWRVDGPNQGGLGKRVRTQKVQRLS